MSRKSARVQALAAMAPMVAIAFLLRHFPPSRYWYYPACPVHALCGWSCPGCGGTRAIAALLAGHWDEALRWNSLIVLLSPLAMILAALQLYSAMLWNRWRELHASPLAIRCLMAIVILFGLARNI